MSDDYASGSTAYKGGLSMGYGHGGNKSLAIGGHHSTGTGTREGLVSAGDQRDEWGTYQGGSLAVGFSEDNGEITADGVGNMAFGFARASSDGYGIHTKVRGGTVARGALAGGYTYSNGQIRAESNGSIALGYCSGTNYAIRATKEGAFAIGEASSESQNLLASGTASFAQGRGTQATGFGSVAHGYKSISSGNYATANGFRTKASGSNQFVIGKDNVEDTSSNYSFIIGNGTADNNRSNALTVDWSGNIVCNNIPAPPAGDGTYTLQCTVTNGVATYSWV